MVEVRAWTLSNAMVAKNRLKDVLHETPSTRLAGPRGLQRRALLVYANTNNLGDEIQSLAVKRFLPRVDSMVDRDNLNAFAPLEGARHKVVLNGWFTGAPENWPPSPYLEPLLVSMHVSWSRAYRSGLRPGDVLLQEPLVGYLRHYGPVGARDLSTLRFLERAKVDSYFSGCATLTLPRSTEPRDDELIVLNDLPPHVVSYIRSQTGKRIVETFHANFAKPTPEARLDKAQELLDLYRQASCVITTRLHCALPSMAMGTPTLLLDTATDQYRFEGLSDLLHHCSVLEFLSGKFAFDLQRPPQTLDRHLILADALSQRITAFLESEEVSDSPYPFSDHDLLVGARHVQQLLIQKIESDRNQQQRTALAVAKLIAMLKNLPGTTNIGPLSEEQRSYLIGLPKAVAEIETAL